MSSLLHHRNGQLPNHTDIAAETVLWEQLSIPFEYGPSKKAIPVKHASTGIARQITGLALLAIAIGGILRPTLPTIQAETDYHLKTFKYTVATAINETAPLPASIPKAFNPLVEPDGTAIVPVSMDFSIVVPKVGINAKVIPAVNPTDPTAYDAALLEGVAHSSTSFFPDENGAVYLFSHSTNYEWFVKDLNAVFYLLRRLEADDPIVIVYKGKRYTYRLTEKRVVKPSDVSFLQPIEGKKMLILQTCWPPGSTTERLLIFADLVDVSDLMEQ